VEVVARRGDIAGQAAGAVVLGVLEGTRSPSGALARVDEAARGIVRNVLKQGDFAGRLGETAVLYPPGLRARRLVLVGLGPPAELDLQAVRVAAAAAVRRARDLGAATVASVVHGAGRGGLPLGAAAQAVAEAAALGHYRFDAYRSARPRGEVRRFEVVAAPDAPLAEVRDAVARGAEWARGTCLARDLANTPGQDLVPDGLAERALEIGKAAGASVQVLGVAEMEKLGMGALLAVGRGSVNPPRFVVLDSAPQGARSTVVLVGKGVTFDTGGISIKPRENMHKMKYDMSGAAAVLGVFSALRTVAPPGRVVGLLAVAENMPGGRAMKPGDVLRTLDGTTVEVTNTDAEGRLVLADALAYARRFEPSAVVDLATLTGAVSIALGFLAAGLFASASALAAELRAAGEATGERVWELPLWKDYEQELRSDVADLVNSGAREGGAILGATFLKRFAAGMRWAHLDIASTAWAPADRPHQPRGATGFGVRLLLEWLRRRAWD
jgi:leucyl aminopeptidase